ncbi:cytochrome c biogenesis protein CcdA [Nisaea acidiphila]|uniref:Cytochrome c biogenesis protein CcdA n=1 Tax=Nisaea acidiphila TaxID=1862145 RepID=A0A9J7AUW9_9PROT|nr:cytochrome c biogenesis protein CcdA [Nisaea acidiphila]UUX51547.1 cytochrome c biogenesis protein CcdA [Nisaea acidiphila]
MGFDIGVGGAFAAGLASFLTPCILPIVPFYLCYMAGVSMNEISEVDGDAAARRKVVLSAILFSAGVITVFVGLGASASVFGQQLREYFDILRYAAAVVIGLMGLHFLGVLKIPLLYRQARMDVAAPAGLIGPYLVGLAFAFGWTPCVGPVLAMILFSASATETVGDGVILLLGYGVGMTLPFIVAAAFFGPFMNWMKSVRRYLGAVEKGIGATLLLFAILIGTNTVGVIAQWMLDTFPAFGTIG